MLEPSVEILQSAPYEFIESRELYYGFGISCPVRNHWFFKMESFFIAHGVQISSVS